MEPPPDSHCNQPFFWIIYSEQQAKFQNAAPNNIESITPNDKEIFGCLGKILDRQIVKSKKGHLAPPSICNISTALFAKIISFVCMKDRLLSCERVSSLFYDICQHK